MGLRMAEQDLAFNAELLGARLQVLSVAVASPDAALREARRLAAAEGVCALVGGFGLDQARALAAVAAEHRIPFLNVGAPDDVLRGDACNPYMFHVEASAAMYLDALTAWFVRAGYRRWFYVYEGSDQGQALYQRAVRALQLRHWGAAEVGRAVVPPGQEPGAWLASEMRSARPDVTLLLLPPKAQLNFFRQPELLAMAGTVTGFPHPVTQCRSFLARLAQVAPQSARLYRAALWEATLDAYGARELNSRFAARWDRPMDPPAWAAYQAVKIVCDAALAAGSFDPPALLAQLRARDAVFDVYKGIGVSFRPWDGQLRQSLYLVKAERVDTGGGLAAALQAAVLVGELPEIYRPGTDLIERLDQLGDLERQSRCRSFGR